MKNNVIISVATILLSIPQISVGMDGQDAQQLPYKSECKTLKDLCACRVIGTSVEYKKENIPTELKTYIEKHPRRLAEEIIAQHREFTGPETPVETDVEYLCNALVTHCIHPPLIVQTLYTIIFNRDLPNALKRKFIRELVSRKLLPRNELKTLKFFHDISRNIEGETLLANSKLDRRSSLKSILFAAASDGNVQAVCILKEYGAELDKMFAYKDDCARLMNNEEIWPWIDNIALVRTLLDGGYSPTHILSNIVQHFQLTNQARTDPETLSVIQALVNLLLAVGADVNGLVPREGYKPCPVIHYAVLAGMPQLVKQLRTSGARIDIRGSIDSKNSEIFPEETALELFDQISFLCAKNIKAELKAALTEEIVHSGSAGPA